MKESRNKAFMKYTFGTKSECTFLKEMPNELEIESGSSISFLKNERWDAMSQKFYLDGKNTHFPYPQGWDSKKVSYVLFFS